MQSLSSAPGGLAIDFERSRVNGAPMVSQSAMTLLPIDVAREENGLHSQLSDIVEQALNESDALVFAFGSQYDTNDGIHDVHMNRSHEPRQPSALPRTG
jgi:uncharacterized protein YukJ